MHRLHVVSITCLLAAVVFAGIGGIEHNTAPSSTSTTPAAAPSPASDHVLTPEEQDAADATAIKEADAAAYSKLVAEARKVTAPLKSKFASAATAPVAAKTAAPAVEDDQRVTYLTGMVVVLIVLLAIAVGFAMLRRPAM